MVSHVSGLRKSWAVFASQERQEKGWPRKQQYLRSPAAILEFQQHGCLVSNPLCPADLDAVTPPKAVASSPMSQLGNMEYQNEDGLSLSWCSVF